MDLYLLVKTLHIISATIVFGTGIGIANIMFLGHRGGLAEERVFAALRGETFDEARYNRLFRVWFALGWPAFGSLIGIFRLMVTKPTWSRAS